MILRSPDVVAVAAADGIAVQPIGATEQHGPHLPLTTDALIAEALATRAVARLNGSPATWLLPTMAYGKSTEHSGIPGTITLSSTTLLALCLDLGRSLASSGIRTLVFVNAHGGNPELLQLVARDIREHCGVVAVTVHAPALPLPPSLSADAPDLATDVHAGFYETSLMLALRPETVDLERAAADGLERAAELTEGAVGLFGSVPLPWHTSDVSSTGTIGDPTGADAAWGSAALDAQSDALAGVLADIATARKRLP